MLALRTQVGVVTFAALSAAAMINIFYLQPATVGRPSLSSTPETVQASLAVPVEQSANPATGTQPVAATAPQRPAAPSETVRAVQRELASRGYFPGAQDGIADPVTEAAVLAYETEGGLPLTATPSDELLRGLILGAPAPAPAGAKASPDAQRVVRTLQQALAKLGFAGLAADGTMTVATQTAIRRFEREQGLPETGRISGPVMARAMKLSAARRP